MGLKEIVREGLNWIDIAPCRDKWWTVVTTVMIISGLLAKELLAYQKNSVPLNQACVCVYVYVCVCVCVCVCRYKGITSVRYVLNQYTIFHC